jgi:uncharacterized integral membrane protein (TIGR00697 family)
MAHLKIDKKTKLLMFLSAFFVSNALIAETIGTKIFSLEALLGWSVSDFSLFGEDHLSFNLTVGVLLWPLEFVMTDIVNEYFGFRIVRRISYIAVGLICYAFLMFYLGIHVPAPSWWIFGKIDQGVPNMQDAFSSIFGQGMWIIVGSICAFLFSQFVDAFIFQKIKKLTNGKYVWLRATGSTLFSQMVDSFIVLYIAFGIGAGWPWQKVLAIGLVNYTYKFTMAWVLTPVILLAEKLIDRYLGKEEAERMKRLSISEEEEEVEPIANL